ncbi:MAG: hypothetical protein SFU98_01210 [Leptospiraceae bacterium]|nr:hypothetical protein [Leptospiraceae bacterium]
MKFWIIIFLFSYQLFADTVYYRSGKIETNLKTITNLTNVQIKYDSGISTFVPKSQIKKINFEKVVWKKKINPKNQKQNDKKNSKEEITPELSSLEEEKEEEKRLEKETEEGSEWTATPEEKKIDPTLNATLALIPGYSGYYRTGHYLKGAMFSVAELGAIGLLVAPSIKSDSSRGIFGGGRREPETIDSSKLVPLLFLLGALTMDSYLSYKAADVFNSGTYAGNKYPIKYTNPWSRLWRSALIPGLGQEYAGNENRGIFFGGGSLFLASVSIFNYIETQNKSQFLNRGNPGIYFGLLSIDTSILSSSQSDSNRLSLLSVYFGNELNLQKQKEYSQSVNNLNTSLSIFAAFYFYNLIDAYFFSGTNPIENSKEDKKSTLHFAPDITIREANFLGKSQLENYYGGKLHWNF